MQHHSSSTKEQTVLNNTNHTFNKKRDISVVCSTRCVFINHYTFSSSLFDRNFVIRFENITFIDSSIAVQNFQLHFINVEFINSTLSDIPARTGVLGEICLNFDSVLVISVLTTHFLLLHNAFVTKISFDRSNLTDSSLNIKVSHLWFVLQNSYFINGHVHCDVDFLFSSQLTNVFLSGWNSLEQTQFVFQAIAMKFDVNVYNSSVENNTGGFQFVQKYSGVLPSWIRLTISNCSFTNNTVCDSGGALHVQFYVPQKDRFVDSFVHVADSSFSGNTGKRKGIAGAYGGAIHIDCLLPVIEKDFSTLVILLEKSSFTNNNAQDGGGAIHSSASFARLNLVGCTFKSSNTNGSSSKGMFLLTHSEITIHQSVFVVQGKNVDSSLIELSSVSKLGNLEFTIHCLPWHKIISPKEIGISPDSGLSVVQKLSVFCSACSPSYYVPTDGIYNLFCAENETNIHIKSYSNEPELLQCSSCPEGATCPGNVVMSKPNFWGYRWKSEILFQQCPVGYCCTGYDTHICSGSYNACSGNREGGICGSCIKGYSLSMLSNNCMPDKWCSTHWFWALVIFAAILYMVWYTMKDIFVTKVMELAAFVCLFSEGKLVVSKNIDKGYFGILTYYVQTAASLKISMNENNSAHGIGSIFLKIESFVGLFLSVELSNISTDLCPVKGMTTTQKVQLELLFLFSIYLCWATMFLVWIFLKIILKLFLSKYPTLSNVEFQLINGLVEIMKYTYSGITSIVFYSVACVTIAGTSVWFYDGSVQCFSHWQIAMIIFSMVYVIPFPVMLLMGMKLLEGRNISGFAFLLGTILPLPALVLWAGKKESSVNKVESISSKKVSEQSQQEMFDRFRGGYKTTGKWAPYWECVVIFRRLLIGATALVHYSLYQRSTCLCICVLFLMHHIYVQPFEQRISNQVETMSLFFLCVVSGINLIKSVYLQSGIIPFGSDADFNHYLGWAESMFVLCLILFILVSETIPRLHRKT